MIVVFGSLNADLVFRLPSLPRPGETVITGAYDVIPGGKGANQAFAAARAGADVRMAGCVGDDEFGRILRSSLSGAGVDLGALRPGEARTGCAAIADDLTDDLLAAADFLMLQSEVLLAENWKLVFRARAAGTRVLYNAAPAVAVPNEVLKALDFLVINEIEAGIVAKAAGIAEPTPIEAARRLAGRFGVTCVVTLGSRGAVAVSGTDAWQAPSLSVKVVDSTGAGDAFCGIFAESLDRGMALPDALRRAVVGGALACTRKGAQTGMPHREEIDAALDGAPPVCPLPAAPNAAG